ncbi:hypothetical protein TCAL_15863 [Tigriopus californicus]|uniref:Uncharacterized protein n=1 Tax=Tigriopus californicus TaxID=6832 RepID=A0A553NNG6_TIGCA|nr:uncharacterized protein LOC131879724 [Tigriopus californicus]TRY66988.1 hypothetical protein TCAL_15863 [Tigriopus californicus]
MKTLLVFAAALVGTLAQEQMMVAKKEMIVEKEMKEMEPTPIGYKSLNLPYGAWPLAYNQLPLAYNNLPYAYNTLPYAYNTLPIQPVETKFVPEEFDVEVKTYELEKVETGCKNIFGLDVPCAKKEKRSADEDMTVVEVAPEAETSEVEAEAEAKPAVYAANTLPLTYNTLPVAFNTYNTLPLAYNNLPLAYNTLPVAYNTLPLAYKTLEPKTQEVKVPTPVFKTVVEKIPVGPSCQNEWGLLVPCA